MSTCYHCDKEIVPVNGIWVHRLDNEAKCAPWSTTQAIPIHAKEK